MSIEFYDRSGVAVAYCDDGQHIFLFGGLPVAYLDADAVYSYRGELMGWFEEGWLRDKDGRCVAYSEKATGGPPHSVHDPMPHRSRQQVIPVQERQDPRALRPIHSNAWSSQTASEFFAHPHHQWPGEVSDTTIRPGGA